MLRTLNLNHVQITGRKNMSCLVAGAFSLRARQNLLILFYCAHSTTLSLHQCLKENVDATDKLLRDIKWSSRDEVKLVDVDPKILADFQAIFI
jgi:hypothetical protein